MRYRARSSPLALPAFRWRQGFERLTIRFDNAIGSHARSATAHRHEIERARRLRIAVSAPLSIVSRRLYSWLMPNAIKFLTRYVRRPAARRLPRVKLSWASASSAGRPPVARPINGAQAPARRGRTAGHHRPQGQRLPTRLERYSCSARLLLCAIEQMSAPNHRRPRCAMTRPIRLKGFKLDRSAGRPRRPASVCDQVKQRASSA